MKKLKLDLKSIENDVEISDGYHTFDELYNHRITIYIALCRVLAKNNEGQDAQDIVDDIWRSKRHSDGSMFEGQFVLGISRGWGRQITYHIPLTRWDETYFAETLDHAPEYDGHTSEDVLSRIKIV